MLCRAVGTFERILIMRFNEFWKRYKRDIAKLFTTHFAIAIFSILCKAPFLTIGDVSFLNTLATVISLFIFAFYYYLIHVQLWQTGAKDKLSSEGGRAKLCPWNGLWMGIIASIPSLIFNVVYIFSYFYKDYAAFKQIHTIFACLELIWDSPALGLRLATGSPFVYVSMTVLPALFAGLAYYLGTKEFRLFGQKKAS